MNTFILNISWAVSRGRDTYGYSICRLDAPMLPTMRTKRYRCNGGGYDLVGTVLGDWLTDQYRGRLLTLADKAHVVYRDGSIVADESGRSIYGLTLQDYEGYRRVCVDGACGERSVEKIAEAIGMRWSVDQQTRSRRIYLVTDYGSVDALRAARA